MAKKILTYSSMSCAKTCLRMYRFRYVLGLRKQVVDTPLYVGKMFHEGLEKKEIPKKPENPDWLGLEGDWDADKYKFDCDYQLACAMVNAYLEYWSDDAVETIKAEWEFKNPIGNPETSGSSRTFDTAGKIDKIVKLPDGRIAIMEHKTTSDDLDPEGAYWRKLRMDQQISHYFLAIQEYSPADTVLYDVTRRPALRPKTIPNLDKDGKKIVHDGDGNRMFKKNGDPYESGDEKKGRFLQTRSESPEEYGLRVFNEMSSNPERYFCRREVPRLQQDLDEYKYELWQQQQMIGDCYRNDRWFKNTGACFKWNKPCPYFDICTAGLEVNEGDDAPLGFEFGEKHAELSIREGGEE